MTRIAHARFRERALFRLKPGHSKSQACPFEARLQLGPFSFPTSVEVGPSESTTRGSPIGRKAEEAV
eukprot:CAMPEP_0184255926 /NCGR_PEP_ID=MMETSP0977-20130417/8405_1 /TAXON_ID=483370 /ORGANISM="non described non described, Strain CCMP2097" /LENGTH=66 /DNA_ID=CAMNT_0026561505 /DNA_START=108 /DNA_END=305 /DNA_ORIENTATION=+